MQRELSDFLKMHDVEYKENLPLSSISPIGIGAEADAVVYPRDVEQLVSLLGFLENGKIIYKISGRMSNLLPPDKKYKKIIVRTDKLNCISLAGQDVTADCGVGMARLSNWLCDRGLSGFEELSGIPGSIGGSIVGNAGAFGREISDLLTEIILYDKNLKNVISVSPADMGFGYRRSNVLTFNYVVLGAKFHFAEDSLSSIKHRIEKIKEKRVKTQPVGMRSLGSTFKRPSNMISASKLIDQCGLKGYRIGGAMISEKHAGFIVNIGGATAKDYIDLSDYASECVYSRFNIKLEREVEIMEGGE